ncbi:hypothetical protein [Planctomicrobium sp. SH664]|uniref:hypothetical protein n=1 Tax=Planctomicrobium sp. SH664 TaxID=3448125 RepID=UPI003F5B579E
MFRPSLAVLSLAALLFVGVQTSDAEAGGWYRPYRHRGYYGNYGNYGLYPSYGFYRGYGYSTVGYSTGYRGLGYGYGYGNPYYYGGSLYNAGYGYGYGSGYGSGYGLSYGYGYTPLYTPYAAGYAGYGYPGARYGSTYTNTPYVSFTPMSYTTDYAPYVYGASYYSGVPVGTYGTSYGYSPMCGCGN